MANHSSSSSLWAEMRKWTDREANRRANTFYALLSLSFVLLVPLRVLPRWMLLAMLLYSITKTLSLVSFTGQYGRTQHGIGNRLETEYRNLVYNGVWGLSYSIFYSSQRLGMGHLIYPVSWFQKESEEK